MNAQNHAYAMGSQQSLNMYGQPTQNGQQNFNGRQNYEFHQMPHQQQQQQQQQDALVQQQRRNQLSGRGGTGSVTSIHSLQSGNIFF